MQGKGSRKISVFLHPQANIYGAKDILGALGGGDAAQSQRYNDLPEVHSCLGVRNVARVTFRDLLDVAIQYTFRISVSTPTLPHPPEWPIAQNAWRLMTLDPSGSPVNAAQVQAFFLWAFARSLVVPLVLGAGEQTVVTLEIKPSLTVPPRGFLRVTAPLGFVLPVPCTSFQRDTFSGYRALPEGTTCARGPGGPHAVELKLDDMSYLAAGTEFHFRLGVVYPVEPTELRYAGERWAIVSGEEADLGEAFLERNPAVEGFPVHPRLKAFTVVPASAVAEQMALVTFIVAIQDSLGTFEVVTTTEVSWLIIDMPRHFRVPTLESGNGVEPTAGSGVLYPCTQFNPIYPEPLYFPAAVDACIAPREEPNFRLLLTKNLIVGPDYTFSVGVLHPRLTSLVQRQISLVNTWQVRLARTVSRADITFTSRSVAGYRVVPLLQNGTLRPQVEVLSVGTDTLVSVAFRVVSELSAAASSYVVVLPPPSVHSRFSLNSSNSTSYTCQLWVARTLQDTDRYRCSAYENGVRVDLLDDAVVEDEGEVQIDFEIFSGNASLLYGTANNLWTTMTIDAAGVVMDEITDLPGFEVFPPLDDAVVLPQTLLAMSFANHADVRFKVSEPVLAPASIVIVSPEGFVLYPSTFRPTELPGSDDLVPPTARQGVTDREVVISLPQPLSLANYYAFRLTVGNPVVSPSRNEWSLEVRDADNATLSIDARIPGFQVESDFNLSTVVGELDEPLAENYVHVTISLNERLLADSILSRSTCVASVDEPVCPARRGLETFLVITAPPGFTFQATCGYWVLSRIGSRNHGLPAGSLCRVDPNNLNVAIVQISLSLEPLRMYEFTLQVRNAISVPLENFWDIKALQDGVVRERNARCYYYYYWYY